MLKLRQIKYDEQGNLTESIPCGTFKSYNAIGKRLRARGKVGEYWVLPSNMASIAAMKKIIVSKDKYGKQVKMDGSIY